MKTNQCLIAIALLFSTGAWASGSAPASGLVHEDGTLTPLANVYIIAEERTHGADIVGSRSWCKGISIVKSDAKGRFALVPAGTDTRKSALIGAYKPGFQASGSDRAALEIKMKQVDATDQSHMRALAFVTSPRCSRVNDKSLLIEYYETKSKEVDSLLAVARTQELRDIKNELRFQIDVLRLGEDQAERQREAGEYSK